MSDPATGRVRVDRNLALPPVRRSGAGQGVQSCIAQALTVARRHPDATGLIRAIATSRDRAAFAVLFEHFAPRIKAYFVRLGLDHASAEEATQEVLLTIWHKAAQFDPRRASATTWMFTIARNLRIDIARRQHRKPPCDLSDQDMLEQVPDAILEATDLSGHVAAALAALPPEQAHVIRLAFFDDRPHAEIERVLGIPLGTVKSRLRLGITKLRGLLDRDL